MPVKFESLSPSSRAVEATPPDQTAEAAEPKAQPSQGDFFDPRSLVSSVSLKPESANIRQDQIRAEEPPIDLNNQYLRYGVGAKNYASHTVTRDQKAQIIEAIKSGDMGAVSAKIDSISKELEAERQLQSEDVGSKNKTGNISAVRMLRDSSGATPAHWAASENKPEIIKHLYESNPGFYGTHPVDSQFRTALHVAAQKGNTEALQELQKQGHKINERVGGSPNQSGFEGISERAARLGSAKMPYEGYTSMHFAAREGNMEALQAILNTPGVDKNPNLIGSHGGVVTSPADLAAMYGHREATALLKNAGQTVSWKEGTPPWSLMKFPL